MNTNYIARNPVQFAERHVLSIDQVRFGLTPGAEDFALAIATCRRSPRPTRG